MRFIRSIQKKIRRTFRRFMRQFQRIVFMISNPLKKVVLVVFLWSTIYVFFFKKMLVQNVLCNFFGKPSTRWHPEDLDAPLDASLENEEEARQTRCRARFSKMYYRTMCCFLVLGYFISIRFLGKLFFYSPVYSLLSMVSRIKFGVYLGFNINFLLITFLLSYFVYMFMYIRGYDEPFISLLDRKKSVFAQSTYIMFAMFVIAFMFFIFV